MTLLAGPDWRLTPRVHSGGRLLPGRMLGIVAVAIFMLAVSATVCAVDLPVFDTPYERMPLNNPTTIIRDGWVQYLDVGLLLVALSLASWFILKLRSRKLIVWLSLACLGYFGFFRHGCICPVGSFQNIARGLCDSSYYVSIPVVATFTLPLVFALLFGRVFCGAVCPLGVMQDLVLVRNVRLPRSLQRGLGVLRYVLLGAGVLFAATGAGFIICQYDPFVPFFRMAGPLSIFALGTGVMLLSTFIGRPFCRFVCPYGVLLSLLSRVSWKAPTITPAECIVCRLCEDACPYDAIEPANAEEEDAE